MIVDDEPPAREGIRLRLEPMDDIEVIGEYGTASEAMSAIESESPDLLFLDVQMPGVDGIEMLRRIGPDVVPAVVLVTAHETHAIEAFEVNVVDYILKPIEQERFLLAVDRARARLDRLRAVQLSRQLKELLAGLEQRRPVAADSGQSPQRDGYLVRFLVPTQDGEVPVNVRSVDWIEASGDYVRLHIGGKYVLLRESMAQLERMLDPHLFARIHRRAIVRLDSVDRLQSLDHGDCEVQLRDGTVLRVSRTYRDRFRMAMSRRPSPGSER
jgi:two-component system LytT family response regulator